MTYPCIITDSQFTIYVFGIPRMIHSDNVNYHAVLNAYKRKDFDEILSLIDKKEMINTFCEGKIILKGNSLYFGEEVLDNTLTKRLLQMKKEGFDINPLVAFMGNLIQNPSYESKQDLYKFLEHNNMPITDQGNFLGYKWVKNDYKDCHTGTVENKPGTDISMPREQVNSDNQQTCSTGYHICSHKYMKFGAKLMLCSINPKDVVAVPPDYNNSKMRVCAYTVIKEIPAEEYKDWTGPSVFSEVDYDEDNEEDEYSWDSDEDNEEDEYSWDSDEDF